ncbi:epithelial membrane protein 2-like isoform X1 [Biomphalaria glabrata]|uniref:Epithelial membrane protein 2-like isoform X1 n=2 Tax=Biomphalaria glabrata TaxID=6526 RepID=A0A9W2ZK75_BIOGL|nr:epithelial membrane protein 2-like isoform X1 [Biomphalaria glabrata]
MILLWRKTTSATITMGVKDGFMSANTIVKIVFFVVLLAVIVNWIAFCTTSWYVVKGTPPYTYHGLWRSCSGTASSSSPAKCSFVYDGSPDDDLDAIQAFAIFGFIALNVGFLLIVLYMFWGSCKGNGEAGLAAAITLFVSAGSWLISVAIFGAKFQNLGGNLGYSFALAVCALILALVGGILMIIGGRGKNSVISK